MEPSSSIKQPSRPLPSSPTPCYCPVPICLRPVGGSLTRSCQLGEWWEPLEGRESSYGRNKMCLGPLPLPWAAPPTHSPAPSVLGWLPSAGCAQAGLCWPTAAHHPR